MDEGGGGGDEGEWVAIYSENAIRAGLVSNGQATPTLAAFSAKWMLVITEGSQKGAEKRGRKREREREPGGVGGW